MKNPTITIQDPHEQDSMTLRDYFAAKAMSISFYAPDPKGWERDAERAYAMADAMLKAREQ